MAFRRKKDKLDRWRRENSTKLTALGMPEAIVADHDRFLDVVFEGSEMGWNPQDISEHNAEELLKLLENVFDAKTEYLLVALSKRSQRGNRGAQ
jgi:hypothetical protein